MSLIDFAWVAPLCLLTLVAVCSETLRAFLNIQFISWSLRRQGVPADKIHEYALAQATDVRPNPLIEIVKAFRSAK